MVVPENVISDIDGLRNDVDDLSQQVDTLRDDMDYKSNEDHDHDNYLTQIDLKMINGLTTNITSIHMVLRHYVRQLT